MWNIENSYKYTVIFTLKINKKYKNTHCAWKNVVNVVTLFLYDNISEILNYIVL